MEKISFKQFLVENESLLIEINDILATLTDDEINAFGEFLLIEFFDVQEEELDDTYFDLDDVLDLIIELGEENYEVILDLLSFDDTYVGDEEEFDDDKEYQTTPINYDDLDSYGEIGEAYSIIFKPKSYKRKRTFFTATKSQLLKTKAANRIKYRQKKAKLKTVLKINKMRIDRYRKSRNAVIKSKKHIVQHHRGIKGV